MTRNRVWTSPPPEFYPFIKFSEEQIEELRQTLSHIAKRELTTEYARESAKNLSGFFQVLGKWALQEHRKNAANCPNLPELGKLDNSED